VKLTVDPKDKSAITITGKGGSIAYGYQWVGECQRLA